MTVCARADANAPSLEARGPEEPNSNEAMLKETSADVCAAGGIPRFFT